MQSLPGTKQESEALATLTSKTETECRTVCLGRSDCDAFSYDNSLQQCDLHANIEKLIKDNNYNYHAKTCPGTVGTDGNMITSTILL